MSDELPRLFCCHCCELIGPETVARKHQRATGHRIEEIPEGSAYEIRELWRDAGRDPVDGSYPAPRLDRGVLLGMGRTRGSRGD